MYCNVTYNDTTSFSIIQYCNNGIEWPTGGRACVTDKAKWRKGLRTRNELETEIENSE